MKYQNHLEATPVGHFSLYSSTQSQNVAAKCSQCQSLAEDVKRLMQEKRELLIDVISTNQALMGLQREHTALLQHLASIKRDKQKGKPHGNNATDDLDTSMLTEQNNLAASGQSLPSRRKSLSEVVGSLWRVEVPGITAQSVQPEEINPAPEQEPPAALSADPPQQPNVAAGVEQTLNQPRLDITSSPVRRQSARWNKTVPLKSSLKSFGELLSAARNSANNLHSLRATTTPRSPKRFSKLRTSWAVSVPSSILRGISQKQLQIKPSIGSSSVHDEAGALPGHLSHCEPGVQCRAPGSSGAQPGRYSVDFSSAATSFESSGRSKPALGSKGLSSLRRSFDAVRIGKISSGSKALPSLADRMSLNLWTKQSGSLKSRDSESRQDVIGADTAMALAEPEIVPATVNESNEATATASGNASLEAVVETPTIAVTKPVVSTPLSAHNEPVADALSPASTEPSRDPDATAFAQQSCLTGSSNCDPVPAEDMAMRGMHTPRFYSVDSQDVNSCDSRRMSFETCRSSDTQTGQALLLATTASRSNNSSAGGRSVSAVSGGGVDSTRVLRLSQLRPSSPQSQALRDLAHSFVDTPDSHYTPSCSAAVAASVEPAENNTASVESTVVLQHPAEPAVPESALPPAATPGDATTGPALRSSAAADAIADLLFPINNPANSGKINFMTSRKLMSKFAVKHNAPLPSAESEAAEESLPTKPTFGRVWDAWHKIAPRSSRRDPDAEEAAAAAAEPAEVKEVSMHPDAQPMVPAAPATPNTAVEAMLRELGLLATKAASEGWTDGLCIASSTVTDAGASPQTAEAGDTADAACGVVSAVTGKTTAAELVAWPLQLPSDLLDEESLRPSIS